MICMYPNDDIFDFRNNYQSWQPHTIITNIPITVEQMLKKEGVDTSKIAVLTNELSFIKTDKDLTTTAVLKEILQELEDNVIPLFNKKTAYDIIGKFYEEFLRYAGVANVKKGIVLTPNHITNLFSELIDIKTDDIIFDPACGTGAFLIAGMNTLIDIIDSSRLPDKKDRIANIKTTQLIGIEKSTSMFTLAISNMLFRGDGKSQIFNEDFFSREAADILKHLKNKPTIGFINPPFGGKANKEHPTKKEIQFLEKLLDTCSRYVIIIAPLSTYFKDEVIRTRILTKHRLKYVINMPNELFQPNAMTHTAIAVFETNIPHTQNDTVVLYDLKDDGFVLSKNKGRTDPLNKWNNIKKDVLKKIKNPTQYEDNINLVYKSVTGKDEWIIQAHSKTDYGNLSEKDFLKGVRKYVIFQTKKNLNLLNEDIDALAMLEILSKNNISAESMLGVNFSNAIQVHSNQLPSLWKESFKEFNVSAIFVVERGQRITKLNQISGETAYISSTKDNNGIDDYIMPPDYMKIYQNALTLNNSGSVGYCFYHPYQFVASDHCTVLLLKDSKVVLNTFHALFLKEILENMKYKYNFGREINNERIHKEIINLPAKQNAKREHEPDWQFMEDYIKSLPYSGNL